MNTADDLRPRGRLLESIDCTGEYPADRYFAQGKTEVCQSPAGRYRQAEGRPLARFGYRFAVEHAGQPHLALIRYPDDRRRFMCIMDGTCYDLTTGVFTGGAQPLSNRMLELRQVFWPRWQDCSIVFTTWSHGEPAAAASVEVYQLEPLPVLDVPGDPGDGSRRELGIQYEDPCGTGASEGATSREEWVEHVAAYMRYSGQKLLVYPLVWYHGPQYPSTREPADAFDLVVGRDRRQYVRWTTRPPEWVAPLLERFGREGLEFQASLTLLRLGSLMAQMNTDPEAVNRGAETINNLLWQGQVQSGTSDWTVVYNVRNYPALLDYYAAGRDMKDFPWAYGERGGPHPAPLFNPLHPQVQEAVVGVVREIAQRYGGYPAFTGISLNLWHATILWFASLHAGYDDVTVNAFAADTGIEVPGDSGDPSRFGQRYEFLTFVCRPAWIEWRCRRVRDLVRRIRDAIVEARPDLRLVLTLWDETTVPQTLGWTRAAHQLHSRPNTVQLYREGGLDAGLFRDEPGVELDLSLGNTRDRGGHPRHSTSGVEAPLEATTMYRDHDFLDRESLQAIAAQRRPGVFVFNCWVEAWGEHRWFPCEPGDEPSRDLALMSGQPAEGLFRMNSKYPEDGFWWDSQLRITPPFQGGVHFLEPYAHAVAELDACRITRGGLFLDKAHSEELQGFARAFRSLPRERFATVGTRTDPVALRTLVREGRRFFYLVNREYYPVEVEVQFDRAPKGLVDLASNQKLRGRRSWRLAMGPYALRSFAVAPEVGLRGFVATPPADLAAALLADAAQAVRDLESLVARGRHVPGMDQMTRELQAAVAEGRLAWLRRALAGYVVRKCRQVLAEPAS